MGGEVAGALSILPENQTPDENSRKEKKLSIKDLSQIIIDTNRSPFNLSNKNGRKLSLAGAQNKLPISIIDGNYYLSGGLPSTHILKPNPERKDYENLVYNEYFCMQLCSKLNIKVAQVSLIGILDENGIETDSLCVERYDRIIEKGGIRRIHQEDFCQITGHLASQKYDSGCGMDFKDIVDFINNHARIPVVDKNRFLDVFIFNMLIGNKDAHPKNFSFLHSENNKVELSPAYDLVCTAAFEGLDSDMAMGINGQKHLPNISKQDFSELALEIGLKPKYIFSKILGQCMAMKGEVDKLVAEFEGGEYFEDTVKHIRIIRAVITDNIRIVESALLEEDPK
jgi:serine/threonine-protein kinase HipA